MRRGKRLNGRELHVTLRRLESKGVILVRKTLRVAHFLLAILLSAPIFSAGGPAHVKVTFKTLSCGGETGLASVDADSIVKIQSVKCDEGDPVARVYQVLEKGEPGSGVTYRAFTTSEDEAARLMEEVEAFQKEKRERIREGSRIIIEKKD